MKIQFLKNKGTVKAGEVLDIEDDLAKSYIANNIAILPENSVKSKKPTSNSEE